MPVSNFNSPVGLVGLGSPSEAERDALNYSSVYQPFGRRGLAAALGMQRMRSLDALRGDINQGNAMRYDLEGREIEAGKFGDILGYLGQPDALSRTGSPLNTAALLQRTGQVPFSGDASGFDPILEEAFANRAIAGAESERGLALERSANAGMALQDPVASLLDPLGPQQQDFANSLPVQRAQAGNPGQVTVTTEQIVPTPPGSPSPLMSQKVQTRTGANEQPQQQNPAQQQGLPQAQTQTQQQQNDYKGVQLSGVPINDPQVQQSVQTLVDKLTVNRDPSDLRIQYIQTEDGRRIVQVEQLSTSEFAWAEVLEDGTLQWVEAPNAQP